MITEMKAVVHLQLTQDLIASEEHLNQEND